MTCSLRLSCGGEFGPDLLDNCHRKQVRPRNRTVCCFLDRATEMQWNRTGSRLPRAYVRGMGANGACQCAEASAFGREIGGQVHSCKYSDALKKSNSDAHIYNFSDLLCNR